LKTDCCITARIFAALHSLDCPRQPSPHATSGSGASPNSRTSKRGKRTWASRVETAASSTTVPRARSGQEVNKRRETRPSSQRPLKKQGTALTAQNRSCRQQSMQQSPLKPSLGWSLVGAPSGLNRHLESRSTVDSPLLDALALQTAHRRTEVSQTGRNAKPA